MLDWPYQKLKQHILSSLDISSSNFSELSQAFSKLYVEFQTDVVKTVTVEPIPNTCFKWVRSKTSDKNKVLIFFHGGGYTMGNTQDHLELIAQLISKTNISVLSVDYRLAPEFPFPAALEDAKSAYIWLLNNGFQSSQIAFSGISAGGLLVTQLIFHCQVETTPLPKLALVLSGLANLHFDKPSMQYNATRDWISAARLKQIQQVYLPKNMDANLLLLSPIDANYLNYPITLFQAGDFEILLDDNIAFYQKLRQQNLPVYLNVVSELAHCWQMFAKIYAPGREAIQQSANFINQHWK